MNTNDHQANIRKVIQHFPGGKEEWILPEAYLKDPNYNTEEEILYTEIFYTKPNDHTEPDKA